MKDALEIFDETMLGVLATINLDGTPWATPLHVATDGEAVYWLSSDEADHSVNIAHSPRVSLSVFSPDESHGPRGVYICGIADRVDDASRADAYAVLERRFGTVPAALQSLPVYALPIGEPNEDKTKGSWWYFKS